MKRVCVYCSTSENLDKRFYDEARTMGELLGKNGFNLVYGGSCCGLMGVVSKSAQENGSNVLGIMPEKLYEIINHKGNCDEFILTKGMRDRKEKMDELSDACIALAGGFGTLDEIVEIIDLKILGYNTKPIIFLNTNYFYDKLLMFFEQIENEHFAKAGSTKFFYVAQTPHEVIEYLKNYEPNKPPKTFSEIYIK